MQNFRRPSAASQRAADRRQREDEAPRLAAEVPDLLSLKLHVGERAGGAPVAEPGHVRRIVVEHAPALFLLPCGDSRCTDGGHDITYAVMRALREHRTTFSGEDHCTGAIGSASCGRTLHFEAEAEYRT